MNNKITKPDLAILPDHTKELKNIMNLVRKSYKQYINDMTLNRVTPLKKRMYKYIFESYLYEVADLSLTRNAIRDDLQTYYHKTYTEGSVLGNQLFYNEYFTLHIDYDKVKKVIWKAIFKVDFISKEDDEKNVVRPDILI